MDNSWLQVSSLETLLKEDLEKTGDYENDSIPRNTADYIELMLTRIEKLKEDKVSLGGIDSISFNRK